MTISLTLFIRKELLSEAAEWLDRLALQLAAAVRAEKLALSAVTVVPVMHRLLYFILWL